MKEVKKRLVRTKPTTYKIIKRTIEDERPRYFYVFAQPPSRSESFKSGDAPEDESIDARLMIAFERLSQALPKDTYAVLDPGDRFTEFRTAFQIQKLPAFGIANVDLTELGKIGEMPVMPNPLDPRKEAAETRRTISENGIFLVAVERTLIKEYKDTDSLFIFIRDLATLGVDGYLAAISARVNGDLIKEGGKKAATAIRQAIGIGAGIG